MKTNAEPIDSPKATRPEPVEVLRLGKDEMNIAEFPISLVSDRVPKGKKVIQFQDKIYDEKSQNYITRKVTISADEAHGLPTAVDDDVVLGLIQLTKMVNNFSFREVEFSRLDLIRLLGWPDSGDSYRRLTKSLKRWLSVTLLYENAWRDNSKGVWTTKGFHILDNIELNDTRLSDEQGELFPSKIIWNKVVFESFSAGYLKTIDYGLYLSLRHSISRRLYRFLSKRMYFCSDLSFDLHDLAFAHVGLSDSYSNNAGKIKEKLQPGIEELEKVGFLEPLGKEERYRKDGKNWQVRLIAKSKPPALPDAGEAAPDPSTLVAQLIRRGITAKAASDLVQKYPAEVIETKIDVFDWLVEKQDKRIAKSPEGYLVKSISDDYKQPKGFMSAADRQRQAEARKERERQSAEHYHSKREQEAKERDLAAKVTAYLKALTPDQLRQVEAEAIAQADEESRLNLGKPELKLFRKALLSNLVNNYLERMIVADTLPVFPL